MTGSSTQYIAWLASQGAALFDEGGITWRRYRSALVPADPTQPFVQVDREAVKRLPRRAGVPLARWSTDPTEIPTEWWHVVCSRFERAALSSNARNQIKKSLKRNVVRKVSPHWLATHGFRCYAASYQRYVGATPMPEEAFRTELKAYADAPLEIWGVFADEDLVGYARVIVEKDRAALTSMRLDPTALRGYSAYALLTVMLEDVVTRDGLTIQNGARAVAHETAIQDFLLKFGFERKYGRLEVVYSPYGFLAASVARLAGPLVKAAPRGVRTQLLTLQFQDKIRRSTQPGSISRSRHP